MDAADAAESEDVAATLAAELKAAFEEASGFCDLELMEPDPSADGADAADSDDGEETAETIEAAQAEGTFEELQHDQVDQPASDVPTRSPAAEALRIVRGRHSTQLTDAWHHQTVLHSMRWQLVTPATIPTTRSMAPRPRWS